MVDWNPRNWIDWKKLTVNVVIGYVVSWAFTFVAYFMLKGFIGKVKAAFVSYVASWPVWIGATIFLSAMNPSGVPESPPPKVA